MGGYGWGKDRYPQETENGNNQGISQEGNIINYVKKDCSHENK